MKYALRQQKTLDLLHCADPGNWTLIPFFFHDRGSHIQKSITGLIEEILFELVRAERELLKFIMPIRLRRFSNPKYIKREMSREDAVEMDRLAENMGSQAHFHDDLFAIRTWSLEELQEALEAVARQSEVALNVMFCIDALDEHYGNHRTLVKVIQQAFLSKAPTALHVKICLASRPEPVFMNAFDECPGLCIHEHTRSDVKRYTLGQMVHSNFNKESQQDISELHELASEVTDKANGVFIWVRIVVEELVERFIDGSTISQLRTALSAIPEELQGLYCRVLSKIRAEYALESYTMIQIVLCAKSPQTLASLSAATDVALYGKPGKLSHRGMLRRLRSRCGGLIEEDGVGPGSRLQFLHQTVKSFFKIRNNATAMFHGIQESPIEDGLVYILKFCIYIASEASYKEVCENERLLMSLFVYAADASSISALAMSELLESLLQESRSGEALLRDSHCDFEGNKLDGLHVVDSYFEPMLFGGQDAQFGADYRKYDLLTRAASFGVLSYVQLKTSRCLPAVPIGRRPLLHSAIYLMLENLEKDRVWAPSVPTHAPELISMLIKKGADPKQRPKTTNSWTWRFEPDRIDALGILLASRPPEPHYFSEPAWPIIFESMKRLLIGGADPNATTVANDGIDRSLLSSLLNKEHNWDEVRLEMMRILVQFGADCNQVDIGDGYRPLYFALTRQLWQPAKLLLQSGADPSDVGNGLDALELTTCKIARSVREEIARFLSSPEIEPLAQKYKTNITRPPKKRAKVRHC